MVQQAVVVKAATVRRNRHCLFFESNVIGNEGGDNSLRIMENIEDAGMYDSYDEFDGDDISTLNDGDRSSTPAFKFTKTKKSLRKSKSLDGASAVSGETGSEIETEFQSFKKLCTSILETPEEKKNV